LPQQRLKDNGYVEPKNTGRCLEIGIKLWKNTTWNQKLAFQSDKDGRPQWTGVRTLSHPEIGTNSLCESEFTSDSDGNDTLRNRKDNIVCGKKNIFLRLTYGWLFYPGVRK
jgi:hypothetical protein